MLRDLIVNAKYHWIRFTGQLGDPKRTFLSLQPNVGDVGDLGFHVPYRIRKRAKETRNQRTGVRITLGARAKRCHVIDGLLPPSRSLTKNHLQFLRPLHFGFTVARRHAMAKQKQRMAVTHKRDRKNLEFHLLDTSHFALEEDGGEIARYMENFLGKQVKRPRTAA